MLSPQNVLKSSLVGAEAPTVTISWSEMNRLTSMLHMSLSQSELKAEWDKMNTNHDNSVDKQEFMQWWIKQKRSARGPSEEKEADGLDLPEPEPERVPGSGARAH